MVSRVIIVLAFCTVAVASPIIRIKTVNGQKKSYCCYGVVRPFDMEAKARQGLRALAQVGFNLRKLRIALDFHQKAVEGKLENVEKEAEDLNKRVREALQATMKILSDATKKASKTLSEVTAATNDLGKLGKDIQGTKTFDMITKIRAMIAKKPADKKSNETKDNDKKPDDKNTDVKKPKDAKSDDMKKEDTKSGKKSEDMKPDSDKTAKTTKPKETKKEDQAKNKKNHKALRPKDRIPGTNKTDKSVEAQRLLVNAEMYENEQVKRARNAIEKKKEENKRAFEKAKGFLRQIQDGLIQFQHGIANEAGIELN